MHHDPSGQNKAAAKPNEEFKESVLGRVIELRRRPLPNVKLDRQFKRRFYSFARAAHVYFSTYLLALLVFFCISGIVINHQEWLKGKNQDGDAVVTFSQTLNRALNPENVFAHPPIAQIEKELKQQFGLHKVRDISLDKDAGEIILDYDIPAGFASVIINTQSQDAVLEYRQGGFWAVMGDLHKGRHSGEVWSWVIDLSAVVMLLFGVTGLIILLQSKKFRGPGLVWAAIGILSPVIIYWLWVPKLTGVVQ